MARRKPITKPLNKKVYPKATEKQVVFLLKISEGRYNGMTDILNTRTASDLIGAWIDLDRAINSFKVNPYRRNYGYEYENDCDYHCMVILHNEKVIFGHQVDELMGLSIAEEEEA